MKIAEIKGNRKDSVAERVSLDRKVRSLAHNIKLEDAP